MPIGKKNKHCLYKQAHIKKAAVKWTFHNGFLFWNKYAPALRTYLKTNYLSNTNFWLSERFPARKTAK